MTMLLEDTEKVKPDSWLVGPKRNRHKCELGKFQLFYCENGQILEKVTQTDCNLFSHGNIQESTGRVPK